MGDENVAKDKMPKHLFFAFLLALCGYVLFFACDQYLRTRKGPWVVEFGSTNGTPEIVVRQEKLGISDVHIVFLKETNTLKGPVTLVLDRPMKATPFGEVKFEDYTYLPGSVTFDFFGHQVELLPRALIVNRKEIPWSSGTVMTLTPADKLPPVKLPKKMIQRPATSGASTNSR